MDMIALINIAILVVISVLWWGFYDAPHPPPEGEADPLRSLAMSGMFAGPLAPPTAGAVSEPLGDVLSRIGRAGGYGALPEFIAGASEAYELIVGAFARGDLAGMAHLLSAEVQRDFAAALAARQQRGETEALTFIGLDSAEIIGADLERTATIDVRFAAAVVAVTRDAGGHVIAGHPDRVVGIAEIWTFERDTRERKPRWLVAGTDADG